MSTYTIHSIFDNYIVVLSSNFDCAFRRLTFLHPFTIHIAKKIYFCTYIKIKTNLIVTKEPLAYIPCHMHTIDIVA